MATVASHGQLYSKISLGQPLPTSRQKKNTLGKKRVPLRRRVLLHHTVRVQSQAGFGRGTVKIKEEESEIETEAEQSSETRKFFKLPGTIKLPGTVKLQGKGQSQQKSNQVIFVAGATGKVGSRTVRELLNLGFRVRASTRNVEKAQALFEDLEQTAPGNAGSDAETPLGFFSPAKLFGFLKPKSGKTLEIVECDLEDAESIEPALGNAGVVVCCIGASEKEVLDVSGPYRIDFKATQNLINAACSAEISHFVLVTSLGTQKFGLPAAVLNLFWGVLLWKAKAENALLQSGLPYTIVRPGGMERPTDAYKDTHNLILAEADKLFGGQVSNLQVAELLASIVDNPDVSVNKIIEAVAETTAPLRPIKELLEEIPAQEDKSSSPEPQSISKTGPAKVDVAAAKPSKKQEEEKITKEKRAQALKEKDAQRIQAEKLAEEKLAQAQKEKEEKRIQAEKDEKERLKLQALRKKYEEEIDAARQKEEAANSAAAAALAEKAELEKRVAEVRAKAEAAALAASQAKAVEAAVLGAARKGNVLSEEEKEKIMESVKLARLAKEDSPKEPEPSPKKKPAFSFLGRAAPFSTATETTTDAESEKEAKKEKVTADPELKAKVDKKAAAKVVEKKQQEEKVKKEEESKKLAEQEAAKASEAKKKEDQDKLEKEAAKALEAKKKEEQDKLEKEAKELAEKEAAEAKRKEAAAEAKKKEELAAVQRKQEQEKAEKLKAEAVETAKALAAQEAAAQEAVAAEAERKAVQKEESEEATEAPAPAQGKGFRWFWQPVESEVEQSTEAEVTDVPVQAKVNEQLPPSSTPLSPYARFPGLKPPSSPIPSPPKATIEKIQTSTETPSSAPSSDQNTDKSIETVLPKDVAEEKEDDLSDETREDDETRRIMVENTIAREKEALERAKTAIAFRWPWQKQEDEPPPPMVEEGLETDMISSASAGNEKHESQSLPGSSRPLSPYSMYPALKPPSPPIANPPAPKAEKDPTPKIDLVSSEINSVEQTNIKVELSAEKDNGVVAEEQSDESQEDIEARRRKVEEIAAREREALEKAMAATAFKWPWQKPEPIVEESAASLMEEKSASPPEEEEAASPAKEQVAPSPSVQSKEKSNALPPSSRPLSPYAQFPNLKPPTPPKASSPVQNGAAKESKAVETLSSSSTPLSPYPGFPELKPPTSPAPLRDEVVNGDVPDGIAETDEKIAEPVVSSSFKWPWQQ